MPPRQVPITRAEAMIRAELGRQGPQTADQLARALGVPRALVRAAIAELAKGGELEADAGDVLVLTRRPG